MTSPAANRLPFEFDENELNFEFMCSPGPGGQNVNKVSTACRLRFNIEGSESVPRQVKNRLNSIARNKINRSGELLIVSNRHRNQARNRSDALEKFFALLKHASVRPKIRKVTRPTAGSKHRRIENKKRRSEIKKLRGRVTPE